MIIKVENKKASCKNARLQMTFDEEPEGIAKGTIIKYASRTWVAESKPWNGHIIGWCVYLRLYDEEIEK